MKHCTQPNHNDRVGNAFRSIYCMITMSIWADRQSDQQTRNIGLTHPFWPPSERQPTVPAVNRLSSN